MSTMSTGTIAYPRSRPRPSERADRPSVARAARKSERTAERTRKPARAVKKKAPSRARGSVAERASRRAKWTRADLLDFASRHRVPLLAVAGVLLFLLFFYGPAKGLYQAWRTEGIRQAELSELTATNETYQQDIDRLQTREGIEDEARRRGYVAEGEKSIVVEGLETEEDAQAESDGETPWYLRLTDTIFQYEES